MPARISHTRCLAWLLILMGLGSSALLGSAQAPPGPKAFVIPISGDVDPGLSAYLKRAIAETAEAVDPVIILEMNTFGGRVDSALEMVDTLIRVEHGQTIAFVTEKAISAGALIALACQQLVMRPSTTIGDCAPIIMSKEGPQMMGEKFQSPLRAKFRTLARRNGYPEALTEAMVTADMEVYKIVTDGQIRYLDAVAWADLSEDARAAVDAKTTVVAKGELLTMDDTEARELGFSNMTMESPRDMLNAMGFTAHQLVRLEESWSESFVRFIGGIAPILITIGLAALYMEFKAPGFGLPGIIGIICLALVFLSQYAVGLADYTELLLSVIGLVLLGFEVFVLPGFGIAGFAGLLCICVGLILALQGFTLPDPDLPWEKSLFTRNVSQVVGAFLVAFVTVLATLRYLLPAVSKSVQGPYLAASLKNARTLSPEAAVVRAGDEGIAFSFLRPAGKVRMGDAVIDAVTQGEFIEKDTPVRVHSVVGNRIIVQKGDAENV